MVVCKLFDKKEMELFILMCFCALAAVNNFNKKTCIYDIYEIYKCIMAIRFRWALQKLGQHKFEVLLVINGLKWTHFLSHLCACFEDEKQMRQTCHDEVNLTKNNGIQKYWNNIYIFKNIKIYLDFKINSKKS